MYTVLIAEMLSRNGTVVAGATSHHVAAIERKLDVSGKPWCAVTGWVLIDVLGTEEQSWHLPLVMYADQVRFHNLGGDRSGESTLTGFATGYHSYGILETPGVVYILLGQGCRKAADIETVRAAQRSRGASTMIGAGADTRQ